MKDTTAFFDDDTIKCKIPDEESINLFILEYKKLCEKHDIILNEFWDGYYIMIRSNAEDTINKHIQTLTETTEGMRKMC